MDRPVASATAARLPSAVIRRYVRRALRARSRRRSGCIRGASANNLPMASATQSWYSVGTAAGGCWIYYVSEPKSAPRAEARPRSCHQRPLRSKAVRTSGCQKSMVSGTDLDQFHAPQKRLVDRFTPGGHLFIAGRTPRAHSTKQQRLGKEPLEWQQGEVAQIRARG